MNTTANNIKQRLSLREPLCEALDVVAKLTESLSLKKPTEDTLESFIKEELAKAQGVCPLCRDFERDFPSFAFSIATGIGKTRLMGACIAYLYLKKGIRHFFVLAPNLTLYEKLIRDFGAPSYEKYVFKGISEFVHNQPRIITGENYEQARGLFSATEIQINVFNISKFNTDSKDGKKGAPKMKRLSEYLGQSYFDYLASLDAESIASRIVSSCGFAITACAQGFDEEHELLIIGGGGAGGADGNAYIDAIDGAGHSLGALAAGGKAAMGAVEALGLFVGANEYDAFGAEDVVGIAHETSSAHILANLMECIAQCDNVVIRYHHYFDYIYTFRLWRGACCSHHLLCTFNYMFMTNIPFVINHSCIV